MRDERIEQVAPAAGPQKALRAVAAAVFELLEGCASLREEAVEALRPFGHDASQIGVAVILGHLPHVLVHPLGIVLYALGGLLVAAYNGAVEPAHARGAAELAHLLEHKRPGAGFGCRHGGHRRCEAAADDDDVDGFVESLFAGSSLCAESAKARPGPAIAAVAKAATEAGFQNCFLSMEPPFGRRVFPAC